MKAKVKRQIQVMGHDVNGVPRVFGYGDSEEEARSECMDAALDYIERRRDSGPFNKWSFISAEPHERVVVDKTIREV